jgi:hypothetical protein
MHLNIYKIRKKKNKNFHRYEGNRSEGSCIVGTKTAIISNAIQLKTIPKNKNYK